MGIEATTLQGIATGLQSVGAIAATFGAYNKASSEQQGYEYQSQVARNNAQLSLWQADDAARRGEREEQNLRMRTAALKGKQTASLAARGIDLGEGSALNILTDTDFMGERDALVLRDNTAKDVWGYRQQAQNYNDNAALLDWRSKQVSPLMSAGSTLLTGAGSVASSWYTMRARTSGVGYTPGANAFGYGAV